MMQTILTYILIISISTTICQLNKINNTTEPSFVIELNKTKYQEIISLHQCTLLEIYAYYCPHCKELKPDYQKAAKILQTENGIVLHAIDGFIHNITNTTYYTGFPTIINFINGKNESRIYSRQEDSIINEVRSKCIKEYSSMNDSNFSQIIEKSKGKCVLIAFGNDSSIKYLSDLILKFYVKERNINKYLVNLSINPNMMIKYKDYKVIVYRKNGGVENFEVFPNVNGMSIETFVDENC